MYQKIIKDDETNTHFTLQIPVSWMTAIDALRIGGISRSQVARGMFKENKSFMAKVKEVRSNA